MFLDVKDIFRFSASVDFFSLHDDIKVFVLCYVLSGYKTIYKGEDSICLVVFGGSGGYERSDHGVAFRVTV